MSRYENLQAWRSDAANECAANLSQQITDFFEKENQDAQDYTFIKMTDLSEDQLRDGVVKDWAVHCC